MHGILNYIIGERNERDIIRGVQIRAGAVYVYLYHVTYVTFNVRDWSKRVD